jgi:opacity protein-like surface antigen
MLLLASVAGLSALLLSSAIGMAAEFGDIELSVYALGSWPRDTSIYNQGVTADASAKQGIGAGLRVGLFPSFAGRMLGLEIDSFGHGGSISFPNSGNRVNQGAGRSDLLVLNTMFNLVLRYPGETISPYLGAGAGWSHGILLNPNIAGRADKDFETARTFGHQLLGGIHVMVSRRVFLFGEYRYFAANYHWEGLALDFRAQYGLAGVGLRF